MMIASSVLSPLVVNRGVIMLADGGTTLKGGDGYAGDRKEMARMVGLLVEGHVPPDLHVSGGASFREGGFFQCHLAPGGKEVGSRLARSSQGPQRFG